MRTLDKAIKKAIKLSKKTGLPHYVVYSHDEYDLPFNDFHLANEYDLDTFYNGCEVLFSTEEV